jgi:hypothetical protein
MRALTVLLAAATLVLAPRLAAAHQSSMTHTELAVDGAAASVRLVLDRGDLGEALGGASTEVPSVERVRAEAPTIAAYVLARVEVRDGATACVPEGARAEPAGDDKVAVAWVARCPAPVQTLVVEYRLFFDLDAAHEAVLRVTAAGEQASALLRDGAARFVWELGAPPPSGLAAFVASGVEHILLGFDHLAFVLAMLLGLVLEPAPEGGWRRRRLGAAVRATALVVTSFTVAHSLTLVAAALGWVAAPATLVEGMIAVSIAYTALENLAWPAAPWRRWLTFGFGLLHGLGFARMLAELLPPDGVVLPLLAFNVGVELGQLVVVAAVLPLLWLAAGALGPRRYRRWVVGGTSVALAVLGLAWMSDRLAGTTLLGG